MEERDNHYQVNELKHKNFESEEGLNAVGPVQTVSAVRSNSAILFSEENPINYYYFGIRSKKFFIRTWKGKTEKVILKLRLKRRCFLVLPCDIAAFLCVEAKLLDVSLNLGFELGQVLGAAALDLLVVVEQDVGDVQVMLALFVMSLNNKIMYDNADTKRRQIRTYNR